MKMKIFVLVFLVVFCFMQVGCGPCERAYDKVNYESLTGERGTVRVVSGGQIVETYENATIVYSDSDSQTLWIETAGGNKIYISGDVIVELK